MATDISVVVGSDNTCALLRDCLRSVRSSSTAPDEVFVVDNASVDGSQKMVASECSDVTLIALERSLGFAGANNVALRRGRGSRILDTDCTRPSCGYPFPTLRSEIRQSERVNRLLSLADDPPRAPLGPAPAGPFEVDWSDGACMLLRREARDAVGLLDEQYFLHTEELDWCFNARRAGWSIVVDPRGAQAKLHGVRRWLAACTHRPRHAHSRLG